MYNVLEGNDLFKDIDSVAIEKLFENIRFRKRKYVSESFVSHQGDKYLELMIVLSGSVRGEMTDESYKVINIENIESPKAIAFAYLFGNENIIPVDVIANEESEILYISKSEVYKIVNSNPIFAINYLNAVSTKANFLASKIKFLNFKLLKEKVAKYLLQLPRNGNILVLRETQQQLAEILGVTRSSLAREFANMSKEGLLKIKNKEIEILDEAKLMSIAKHL